MGVTSQKAYYQLVEKMAADLLDRMKKAGRKFCSKSRTTGEFVIDVREVSPAQESFDRMRDNQLALGHLPGPQNIRKFSMNWTKRDDQAVKDGEPIDMIAGAVLFQDVVANAEVMLNSSASAKRRRGAGLTR